MDPHIVEKINRLWQAIYPYLARFMADLYGRDEGDVLELGPFSGGIAKGLLSLSPGFRVVVSDTSHDRFDRLREEIRETPYAHRMIIQSSQLSPLAFLDQSFDIVICRGAFFFLTAAVLQEIYRALRPGGVAIVGGGYGPSTPRDLIAEIAEESKELNLLLGKQQVTEGNLTQMINEAALRQEAEIFHQGGLWLILRKRGSIPEETPSLTDALSLGSREIIALVGGGGKTTLMFALAQELNGKGLKVITTATTKIFEPAREQACMLVVQDDPEQAIRMVREGLQQGSHVAFAAQRFPGGKIGGTDPAFVERMARELPVNDIIIEADGANKLPIKAPADHEPVVPAATTLLVPIIGIEALGKPLNEETAFRPERIAELTGVKPGALITPHLIAKVMAHPQGLIKGAPGGARIISVINKVETTEGLTGARRVAREVLGNGGHRIGRVVLSRLFLRHPIVDIIYREDIGEKNL
jgi:probable selenium-dependent hydroxylase accessory protein YqeC